MEKSYRLPDPQKQPDAFLVILYKTLKCVPFNDRGWDKIYFARCMKRAQELLSNLRNDVQMAARCLRDLKEQFEADGTKWTIETVVGYSFQWRAEYLKVSDRDCLRELANAYRGSPAAAVVPLLEPHREIQQRGAVPADRLPEISEDDRKAAVQVFGAVVAKLRSNGKAVPA